jgi:UDP-N-acetyl-D-mannosaminouronate:lipid I N-acetyl-D-mannosaminouronosyltransferase
MKSAIINNYKINAFANKEEFLNYIKNEKKILIAMNAEKILKNDEKLRNIVNSNIGYPDGVGAVMALKQKGLDAAKIPGSEFWLDIIERYYKERTFYLLGSTQEIIESTVNRLKNEFPNINIVWYRNRFLEEEAKEALKATLITKKPDI